MKSAVAAIAMTAALLAAATAGEVPRPALPGGAGAPPAVIDFEGAEPWKGWQFAPGTVGTTGASEWEEQSFDFLTPAGGVAILELGADGAGFAEFDAIEILSPARRRGPPVRRDPANPGFESSGEAVGAAADWSFEGGASRRPGQAFSGQACLHLEPAAPARALASQKLSLEGGRQHRLTLRYRADLRAGRVWAEVRPEGGGTALAAAELVACTLDGGRGKCGRLSALRNQVQGVFMDMSVKAGSNCTLSLLARGTLGDRGRLSLRAAAVGPDDAETPVAFLDLGEGSLGPDWRPVRMNLALREAARVRLQITVEGPAAAEFDNVELLPPVVVPAPRRMSAGDAGANFRPGARCPLVTSRGREDADLVRDFTAIAGERVARSGGGWRFWRTGRGFDHQARPFSRQEHAALEEAVWLLDASRRDEAAWLAEQAIAVPDRPGAYAMAVSAKALVVAARSREGFLAAASALGWLGADSSEPEIFSCRIEDWPARELRAAAFEFDGRLTQDERAMVGSLSSYRLGQLLMTGRGLWQLQDSKTRSELRDLAALAEGAGLKTGAFIEALGAAPELVEKDPRCAEMAWHSGEIHCLRGTERSRLDAGNVVRSAGADVEVTSEGGETYAAGRDYEIDVPEAQPGCVPGTAPRTRLRRLRGGGIPDGGRVLLSYNALPAPSPGAAPAACPASAEAVKLFSEQVRLAAQSVRLFGVGLGGRLPAQMRTDRRTAGTRFQNGRLTADRVHELSAALALAAPEARALVWGDLLNPCGGLPLPEDSPAASADLIDPSLRAKLTVLVRLDRTEAAGRELIARSTDYLLSRGYHLGAWCGASGAAAEAWAGEFARWDAAPRGIDERVRPGEASGMVIDVRRARVLDLERFARAAWCGALAPAER